MARVEVPFVVQANTGAPQGGATVQINIRGSGGTPATIYSQETGVDTLPNPLTTTANGRIDGWLEEGIYSIVVSGAGLTTYTQHWDAKSGGIETKAGDTRIGNVGPSSQGAVALGPTPGDVTFYRQAAGEGRVSGTRLIIDGETRIGQTRFVGSPTGVAIQDSGGAGIIKSSIVASQFTDNINAARNELANGTNNDALFTGLTGTALRRLAFGTQGAVFANVAAATMPIPTTDSLVVAYAGGKDTLNLSSTAADTGITIGGDVEIFRSTANVLRIPDTVNVDVLQIAGSALASTHLSDTANIAKLNAAQTFSGANLFTSTLTGEGGIRARTAGDTNPRIELTAAGAIQVGPGNAAADLNWFRQSGTEWRTNDTVRADGVLTAAYGTANDTSIGAIGPANQAAIKLGTTVTIYESAADVARTADSFYSDAEVRAGNGGAGQVRIGAVGPTGQAGLVVGSTNPANLYLSAADTIRTDDNFVVAGNLTVLGTTITSQTQTTAGNFTAAEGDGGQVRIGNVGGEAAVYFGTAEDAHLRRTGAGALRTNSTLTVDGLLTASGGVLATALSTLRRAATSDVALDVQVSTTSRTRVLADGTIEWRDGTGVTDTVLGRTGVGVARLTGTLNATVGLQINGTALNVSHLSDTKTGTGNIVLATSPVLTTPTLAASPGTGDNSLAVATTAYVKAQGYITTADVGTGYQPLDATLTALAALSSSTGMVMQTGIDTFVKRPLAGTTNRITVTNPSGIAGDPTVDISTSYVGQASITTLGTITTGVWSGSVISAAYVDAAIARLASPTFTGVPGAPTAAADTNTTQVATTAFVLGQAGGSSPLINGVAAAGTSPRYSRQDHVHPVDTSRAPAAGSVNITTLGTINTGVWNGSIINASYIDAAIARLASPTFTGTVTAPLVNVTTGLSVSGTFTLGGDVIWQRTAANISTLNSAIFISRTSGTALGAQRDTDTNPRFALSRDGAMSWSAGGVSTADVFLGRSATGRLEVTGKLTVTDTLTVTNALTANSTLDVTGVLTASGGITHTRSGATQAVPRIVRGSVASNGTKVRDGGGFSSSKPGTGLYTVTFSTAFTSTPVIVASNDTGGSAVHLCVLSQSTTGFDVQVFNNSNPISQIDTAFSFIAVSVE